MNYSKSIICTFFLFILFNIYGVAQTRLEVGKNENDSLVRSLVLEQIGNERNQNNDSLAKQVSKLDARIAELDKQIQTEKDAQKKIETLRERVQILEKKESKSGENEVGVYGHNYKSAFVNLVFMERELKPLVLFNASREFFEGLGDVSNPMNYKGYKDWFVQYKAYIDKSKSSDATFAMIDNLLNITGDISKGIPLAGPLANTLIGGIGTFINSLTNKNQKQLRDQSQKMFELTAVLSQFTHEKNLIETEWEAINKELDELQKVHRECMDDNFRILSIEKTDFDRNFTNELNANTRFDYISMLTKSISDRVKTEKEKNPEKWKTVFYYQMQTVQSLKVRFGTLTFRIKENISKYKTLIEKYQKSPDADIKEQMTALASKLEKLGNAFDATFSPQAYIKSANNMYIVD